MSESDPAEFDARLDDVETALEAAETESDLDDIDVDLEAIESDLEEADFPEPPEPEDEDEEAPPDPREELSDRLDSLTSESADQRGPYGSDAIDQLSGVSGTVESTEWATEGEDELVEAIRPQVSEAGDILDTAVDIPETPSVEQLIELLETLIEDIEAAQLDADDDAETIAALLDVADELEAGVENATAFSDLPVREQLNRQGFFDILGHHKDFPAEWSALKAHEEERNVEMILLAFDLLDSNYMEEHCIEALRRLGDERAVEPMMALAQRRNKDAIAVLGKIGSDEPVEMFFDYIETDSDPLLQQVTLKALGEIGSTEATEAVAQQLTAEHDEVRSVAARALGMIGDPRAIDPLADVLAEDASASVRGSAAWALVEIGTQEALEIVTDYADDGEYLVEAEVSKIPAAT